MSTPKVEFEDPVAEWRQRLPEVPLAVPEEGEPFRVALPRALVTGAAVAVVGGAACTAISMLYHALLGFAESFWLNRVAWGLAEPVALLIQVILALATVALTFVLLLAVVGRAGAKYGRITYLRANHPTATRKGLVLAGVGIAVMVWLFGSLARGEGLPALLRGKDEWSDYLRPVLSSMAFLFIYYIGMLTASHCYLHRRRHCPRCGGLLTCKRELPLSVGAAEQIAVAAGSDAPLNWPDLSKDSTEEHPERLGFTLLVYRCESCAVRLLEGEISVECPERQKDWDVKWRWLSVVYSPEETAALEDTFPRLKLWDRLLIRN